MMAQKYPKSLIKGSVLYCYEAFTYESGKSSVEIQEWVVRSIQKRRGSQTCYGFTRRSQDPTVHVNLVQRVEGVTWFAFGWAKSISKRHRKKFIQGQRLPDGLYTTQLQALKYSVKKWESDASWYQEEIHKLTDPKEVEEWDEELQDILKELRLLKGRLTRLKNRNSAASQSVAQSG